MKDKIEKVSSAFELKDKNKPKIYTLLFGLILGAAIGATAFYV
ncbi:hypothetical protein LX77_00178 [Gelidibacter algens]|uniref:Uncharacterized protein n=1 Tax=Gelidibacter algens TaxID=49280 RepID=A0A327SF11_9FLAO|nr:hypothetical protein [Gelidibacter algens]RAJ27606.1 hypothetical protein LX77_00178 [Gelidibacter algens]